MKNGESNSFNALLTYLKRTRGFDFTGYKTSSLTRRIQHRMQQVSITSFEDYTDYLEVHPEEFAQLFNTILINVTDFFRDPPAWEFLQQDIVPRILDSKRKEEPLRVWSAGCASGQEAYTMAMVFGEVMGVDAFRERVKIYATDADEDALSQARQATYSAKQVAAIPPALLEKYFERANAHYTFRNDLRRSIIFGRHDLVRDAPISRLDLMICRNVLMYFNSETQGRILASLHFAINETGYLFLGRAEMMISRSKLFAPVNLKHRIFTKVSTGNLRDRLLEMAHGNGEVLDTLGQELHIREAAMDCAPFAQLVIDTNGVLVHVNERARTMFSLRLQDIAHPFQDFDISYRPVELRSLIEQAYTERRTISVKDVPWHSHDGETIFLNVQIAPLQTSADNLLGATVTFIDVTQAHRQEEELRQSTQSLETAYEELQSTNEELETTNEELQSANEELETTNEELQSANEELETMNEELQSSNEELHTVNEEMNRRAQELNQLTDWLESILNLPPSARIIVDDNFDVLLWNRQAEEMWGLRAEEVRGRGFFALDIGLPIEELRAPMRAVLDGKPGDSKFVLDAVNRRGKSVKVQVLVAPFVSADGSPKGAALIIDGLTER